MSQQKPFHFDVNIAHNRANDEYYRDPKQLQMASAGLGLLLIALGVFSLWRLEFTPAGIEVLAAFAIVGIVFFAIAGVIPKKVGTPQSVYDTYGLAPAMITKVLDDRVEITALVDATVDPHRAEPLWALCQREVKKLPGHKHTVDERIPVTAVPGRRPVVGGGGYWADMTLLPIAWGTTDHAVITNAINTIPQAQWRKLKRHLDKVEQVREKKTKLLRLN